MTSANNTPPKVWCGKCGEPLSEGRLKIVPNAKLCAPCLSSMGDVQEPVGIMIFSHKTAPEVFITTESHLSAIVRADRRGYKNAVKKKK